MPADAEPASASAAAGTPGAPGAGGGLLYRRLVALFEALRRRGWPAVIQRVGEGEARGYAQALDLMVASLRWKWRRGEPRWRAVQAAWAAFEGDTTRRDLIAGTLHPQDRTELIADGPAGFARRDALYAQATRSIDIASYYLQPDATGRDTVAAWAAAVARGVRVRVLVDRHAMNRKTVEVDGMAEMLAGVAAAGIELRQWHDPLRPIDSTHRKMIVVDGRTALVGGRNFADHYRGTAWRDLDLVIDGPSVAPLAAVFDALWHGSPMPSSKPWVDHGGAGILTDPMMSFVLAAVGAARRSVELELAYFVDHDSLCGALARAARRGVRVRLLTNSAESNDLPFAVWTGYRGMRRLLATGCEVHVRPGAGRTLHCKYVLVDREWLSFGSHNLDFFSPRFSGENNLVVRDAALAERLGAFFDEGIAQAVPLSAAQASGWLAAHGGWRLYDLVFRDFQ